MLKAYKYRIYPDDEQIKMFEKHFDCVRFVYNWGLGLHKEYEQKEDKLSHFDIMKEIQTQLVQKKKDKQFGWLRDVNSQSLLSALMNLNQAYQRSYNKISNKPKFKSKKNYKRRFQCTQNCKVDFTLGTLDLPKIKGIKIKLSRQFNGDIKTVTISKTPTGKYFASILAKDDKQLPIPTTIDKDLTLGIDLGIRHFLITSEGEKINNPKFFKKYLEQLQIAQKISARKKKESHNYQKQKLVRARIYEKIKNSRLDFHHKLTHYLVCENQATSYALENLAVKNLIRNHNLAQAIQDVGWGQFIDILSYKAAWHSKNVLKVDRFFASSKTCSCCGHKLKHLPLSERYWTCPQCNAFHDRDVNASINIHNYFVGPVNTEHESLKNIKVDLGGALNPSSEPKMQNLAST